MAPTTQVNVEWLTQRTVWAVYHHQKQLVTIDFTTYNELLGFPQPKI